MLWGDNKMKRWLVVFLLGILVVVIIGCGSGDDAQKTEQSEREAQLEDTVDALMSTVAVLSMGDTPTPTRTLRPTSTRTPSPTATMTPSRTPLAQGDLEVSIVDREVCPDIVDGVFICYVEQEVTREVFRVRSATGVVEEVVLSVLSDPEAVLVASSEQIVAIDEGTVNVLVLAFDEEGTSVREIAIKFVRTYEAVEDERAQADSTRTAIPTNTLPVVSVTLSLNGESLVNSDNSNEVMLTVYDGSEVKVNYEGVPPGSVLNLICPEDESNSSKPISCSGKPIVGGCGLSNLNVTCNNSSSSSITFTVPEGEVSIQTFITFGLEVSGAVTQPNSLRLQLEPNTAPTIRLTGEDGNPIAPSVENFYEINMAGEARISYTIEDDQVDGTTLLEGYQLALQEGGGNVTLELEGVGELASGSEVALSQASGTLILRAESDGTTTLTLTLTDPHGKAHTFTLQVTNTLASAPRFVVGDLSDLSRGFAYDAVELNLLSNAGEFTIYNSPSGDRGTPVTRGQFTSIEVVGRAITGSEADPTLWYALRILQINNDEQTGWLRLDKESEPTYVIATPNDIRLRGLPFGAKIVGPTTMYNMDG
ncbi:MAG: hypothetical protein D6711_12845, partial [Chloroflexi bacterium]